MTELTIDYNELQAALRRCGSTWNAGQTHGLLCSRLALAGADGAARVTLLATGSEVALAMAARDILQADGVPTTVVSMPCWELFDAQPADYRAGVLGTDTVCVAVEAGIALGWDRYTGPGGAFVGMSGFGASAPAAELYPHFGITPEAVAGAATARLED